MLVFCLILAFVAFAAAVAFVDLPGFGFLFLLEDSSVLWRLWIVGFKPFRVWLLWFFVSSSLLTSVAGPSSKATKPTTI